jgi:transcriptional regulator NrdR family protein
VKCPYCGSENVRKSRIGNEQRESKNTWKCLDCHRFFYYKPKQETEKTKAKPQEQENPDKSVYSDDPEDTQEDDMEEDLALLSDDDDLW